MPEGKSKKRSRPTLEQLKARPWCYFCERDFDDVSYLIAHQRAKHYKCDECSRRLNTANGLVVHKQQVHKSTVPCIENCTVDGRDVVPAPEIFGMEGMPPELLAQYHQKIEIAFFKEEQEYRAKTGNPPPGTVNGTNGAKRAKIETPEEMKARLAEHRAKRAAEKALKQQGGATPDVKHEASATPPDMHAGVAFPPPGMATSAQSPAQPGFPPPGPEGYPMPGPHGYPGSGLQGYPMPGQPGFNPGYGPPMGMPPQGMPPQGMPPQNWSPGFPQPQAYSPVNMPPYHGPPQQGYPPMQHQPAGPPQYGGPVHRPRQNNGPLPASPANGPPQPSSLPPALGLPARPSFDPPKISHDGMQRMHTGQAPPLNNDRPYPPYRGPQPAPSRQQQPSAEVDQSVADLIKDVERELAEKARAASTSASAGGEQANEPAAITGELIDTVATSTDVPAVSAPVAAAATDAPVADKSATTEAATQPATIETEKPATGSKKKSKKSKDVVTKLMCDDNTTSLEEKMAALSKYAFHRPGGTEYTLDQVGAAVTGIERGEDDVVDPAH
ncbi:hypothetical protein LTR95_010661 [Oleoguttula sp. CCFEE 5521]